MSSDGHMSNDGDISTRPARTWTFFSNHGHVMIFLAGHPDARVRDIAHAVGITERATSAILRDLGTAGYVTVTRQGRRNHYRIHSERTMRHPVESPHAIGEVLDVFG